jgi:hypothetical protein
MTLLRYVGLTSGLVAATLTPVVLLAPLNGAERHAVVVGAGMAGLNTIAAFAIALRSLSCSPRAFLGAILGGMLGRMALLLGGVVAAVSAFGLPAGALAAALLIYFGAFLALELAFVHRATRGARVAS